MAAITAPEMLHAKLFSMEWVKEFEMPSKSRASLLVVLTPGARGAVLFECAVALANQKDGRSEPIRWAEGVPAALQHCDGYLDEFAPVLVQWLTPSCFRVLLSNCVWAHFMVDRRTLQPTRVWFVDAAPRHDFVKQAGSIRCCAVAHDCLLAGLSDGWIVGIKDPSIGGPELVPHVTGTVTARLSLPTPPCRVHFTCDERHVMAEFDDGTMSIFAIGSLSGGLSFEGSAPVAKDTTSRKVVERFCSRQSAHRFWALVIRGNGWTQQVLEDWTWSKTGLTRVAQYPAPQHTAKQGAPSNQPGTWVDVLEKAESVGDDGLPRVLVTSNRRIGRWVRRYITVDVSVAACHISQQRGSASLVDVPLKQLAAPIVPTDLGAGTEEFIVGLRWMVASTGGVDIDEVKECLLKFDTNASRQAWLSLLQDAMQAAASADATTSTGASDARGTNGHSTSGASSRAYRPIVAWNPIDDSLLMASGDGVVQLFQSHSCQWKRLCLPFSGTPIHVSWHHNGFFAWIMFDDGVIAVDSSLHVLPFVQTCPKPATVPDLTVLDAKLAVVAPLPVPFTAVCQQPLLLNVANDSTDRRPGTAVSSWLQCGLGGSLHPSTWAQAADGHNFIAFARMGGPIVLASLSTGYGHSRLDGLTLASELLHGHRLAEAVQLSTSCASVADAIRTAGIVVSHLLRELESARSPYLVDTLISASMFLMEHINARRQKHGDEPSAYWVGMCKRLVRALLRLKHYRAALEIAETAADAAILRELGILVGNADPIVCRLAMQLLGLVERDRPAGAEGKADEIVHLHTHQLALAAVEHAPFAESAVATAFITLGLPLPSGLPQAPGRLAGAPAMDREAASQLAGMYYECTGELESARAIYTANGLSADARRISLAFVGQNAVRPPLSASPAPAPTT